MRLVRLLRSVWRDAYQVERARRARERGRCAARPCIRPHGHPGDHVFPPTLPSCEPREGIVTVYDSEGRYLGCMGSETWARLLEEERSEIFVGKSTQ